MIPRWAKDVYSIELRKLFSYRVDFWVEFVGVMAINVILAYFFWRAVYEASGSQLVGGYTFNHMMAYYILVPLMEKLIRGHERGSIASEIYEGGLTRYLIYPLSLLEYKYISSLAVGTLGLLQFVLTIGIFCVFFDIPETIHISASSAAMAFTAIGFASLLFFMMTACLELVAFWADTVWSLIVMLRFCIGVLGGGLIPLTLFSPWAQEILSYLPFVYIASFPIRTFTGELPLNEWLRGMGILILWIALFWASARLILKRGLYQYTGVGI